MNTQTPRFDQRFVPETTTGRTQKRNAKRALTTIACGSKAFGNAEMRAIFRK